MISACRTGVSDIHVEPLQDNYKVRVRRDGVMQNYGKLRSAGIKLTACYKNMAKWISQKGVHHKRENLKTL